MPTSRFLDAQVAAERRALRLVARDDVQAGVRAQAATWRDGTPGFLPETYEQIPASIAEVVFMVALEVINDDPRRPEVIEISASPHRWGGLDVPGGRWGINNPDTLYFAVPLEAGSRYVVTGRRAPDGPIDSNFSIQVLDIWATLANLGHRDLAIDADGRYRITIDDTPADGRANHLQHQPHGRILIIRQTLADWARSRPDTLSVERVAGPAPAAPRGDDELARQIVARLGDVIVHSLRTLQPPILRLPANTIPSPGAVGDKSGYLVTQRNTLGHFRLGDDDALVAVLDPGGAGYTAFTATNAWGVTPDSARHQHSLNHHQADIAADGTITLVVSRRDPGIHNWIDIAGLREGFLMLRWQLLDEQRGARGGPGISVRSVRFDELASVLPPTVSRVSPDERRHHLLARGAAFASRFEGR